MSLTPVSSAVLLSRTRALPGKPDPLSVLGRDGFAWLRDGSGLATAGVAARIPVRGPGRMAAAAERVAEVLGGIATDDPLGLPGTGPIAVGALPFDDHTPGELIVPAVVVGCTSDGQSWLTETGPGADGWAGAPATTAVEMGPPLGLVVEGGDRHREWTGTVRRALELIAAGQVTKVVLARQLEVRADRPFDLRSIVSRLRQVHPSCWTYAAGGFVGASPELLVGRRDDRVESRPMAGTVAQGLGPDEDERLVAELEASAKERAEHALVVDEVLAGLAPVCDEVFVEAEPDVVRLATVAHLATSVAGRLHRPPPSALALAGLLHPTPAVAGIPRQTALAAISEMEGFDRGLYAGPVGWVDERGDGEWAVALRGAEVRGDRAVLTAGAGIVCDSDADAEWNETRAKLEAMLGALEGRSGTARRPSALA